MQRAFQLVNWLDLTGVPTVCMNWYRHIDRANLQFDFCVGRQYDSPLVDEIEQKKGRIFILPQQAVRWGKLKYYWQLYKLLKSNGPYEVFQTHNHLWSGVDCLVAKLAGIKKRFTISHCAKGTQKIGYKIKFCLPFCRLLMRLFSTEKLAVSRDAGEFLYGKHMPFKIVHNGIDLQKFIYNPTARARKRAELGLENKFIVGHIGRFSGQKNHAFLIKIFAEIYKRNSQAHLVLLGKGTLEASVRQKVEELGLAQAVSFMGSRADVAEFYQAFDVFVLPSLYEGLPCVGIEAQGAGLPCFLADTIAKETALCNTQFLSLKQTPAQWATTILKTTQDFVRRDESAAIAKAGFDIIDVGQFIQAEYLS